VAHRQQVAALPRAQRLFAISNNWFAESYQDNLAISICRPNAAENGLTVKLLLQM
jgi:hypothetical protein